MEGDPQAEEEGKAAGVTARMRVRSVALAGTSLMVSLY
jgi:hypothetical protein